MMRMTCRRNRGQRAIRPADHAGLPISVGSRDANPGFDMKPGLQTA
jgi:hypothetical protein